MVEANIQILVACKLMLIWVKSWLLSCFDEIKLSLKVDLKVGCHWILEEGCLFGRWKGFDLIGCLIVFGFGLRFNFVIEPHEEWGDWPEI